MPQLTVVEPISDNFGRHFHYLRVAIIEQCNLRCIYCMPEEGVDFLGKKDLLSADEFLKIIGAAAKAGVTKVRFTGGEPLLHPQVLPLIKQTADMPGVASTHITTNGILLKEMAGDLKKTGLSGINISLDTLNADRFEEITRRGKIEKVLSGIEAAKSAGFKRLKINVVALRGFNDDEILDFAELTREVEMTVRFIELMPFDAHQIWKTGSFLRLDQVLKVLEEEYGKLPEVAGSSTETAVYQIPSFRGKIAFIPAYTRGLCSGCDRIRLTADGKILNCLYSHEESDLLAAVRSGAADGEIIEILRSAMLAKAKDGWYAQEKRALADVRDRSSMTVIGG